jgi:hypothetical protein
MEEQQEQVHKEIHRMKRKANWELARDVLGSLLNWDNQNQVSSRKRVRRRRGSR